MTPYFLHIPKTAGSSVRSLMLKRFGSDLCPAHVLDQLIALGDERVRYKASHGHFMADLDRVLGRPLSLVTMLRDPVARTVSCYLYVRRNPNHPYHAYIRTLSLRAFVDDPVTYPLIRNMQARYLCQYADCSLGLGARV